LNIINDKHQLPAITLCSNTYFSIEKIKSYFNITDEFYRVSKQNSKSSGKDFEKLFYGKYMRRIRREFSANKFGLTISAEDLFNCSANLHESKNLKRKVISDCEENTRVIESFNGKQIGKCFTYFGEISSDRDSIIFLNNDCIKFGLKETNLIDLQSIIELSSSYEYNIYVHSPRISILQPSEGFFTIGFFYNELRFRMTQISLLSWPYEHDCYQCSGIFSLFNFNSGFFLVLRMYCM
jgi:hypothetical protein